MKGANTILPIGSSTSPARLSAPLFASALAPIQASIPSPTKGRNTAYTSPMNGAARNSATSFRRPPVATGSAAGSTDAASTTAVTVALAGSSHSASTAPPCTAAALMEAVPRSASAALSSIISGDSGLCRKPVTPAARARFSSASSP